MQVCGSDCIVFIARQCVGQLVYIVCALKPPVNDSSMLCLGTMPGVGAGGCGPA